MHQSNKTKPKHSFGGSTQQVLHHQNPHFAHQTISRSNNIHRQVYGHPRSLANLSYYDQPMSLTMRMPRERPILPPQFGPHGPMMMMPAPPPSLAGTHYPNSNTFSNSRHSKQLIQQQIYQEPQQQQQQQTNLIGLVEQQARLNKPLCRCRVMYLGSSVPHITKNGLHGIQEPLRHLYPEEQFSPSRLNGGAAQKQQRKLPQQQQQFSANSNGQQMVLENTIDISHLSSSLGIDSWLSVWSNGLLLENFDEFGREIKRFFSIESLHYCAAIRFFDTSTLADQQQYPLNGHDDAASESQVGPSSSSVASTTNADQQNKLLQAQDDQINPPKTIKKGVARFLPLDAPIFQYPGMMDANHPPVFASIMRRTSGIKVLECHAFICRRDAAANALVRCCTHAYADFLSAKRLSADLGGLQFPATSSGAYHYPYAMNDSLFIQQQQQQQQQHQYRPSRRANHDSMTLGTQRSASAGRPNSKRYSSNSNSNQRVPVGPQYQVVEAVVNQTRSSSQAMSKKRGASSSGCVSQETDNSLEISSEDNYAIIPKHGSLEQTREVDIYADNNNNNNIDNDDNNNYARSRSKERRKNRTARSQSQVRLDRRIKGSSKSLFKDFMPPPAPPQVPRHEPLAGHDTKQRKSRRHMGDSEKRLSQSLDYIGALAKPISNLKPSNDDDLIVASNITSRQANQSDDSVQYSIVKHKRHSKSMQNLECPFEFRTSMLSANGKSSTRDSGHRKRVSNVASRSKYCNQKNSAPFNEEKARKAASYQDMSRYFDDSISSDQMTIHSCNSQSATNKNINELNNNNSRIYDICADPSDRIDHLDSGEHNIRVLTSDGYIIPSRSSKSVLANGSSKSATMISSRSKSRSKQNSYSSQHNDNRNLPDQQVNHRTPSNIGQNYMNSFNGRGLVAPQPPPPPPLHPTPASSYYQPSTASYSTHIPPLPLSSYHPSQANLSDHHHHMQLYSHNQPQQPVYMHPYFIQPIPYHHSHHQNQSMYSTTPLPAAMAANGQPVYESASDAHYIGPLNPYYQSQTLSRSTLGRHMYANNNTSTIEVNGNKKSSAKTSLATRFRCLSPPANFLTGLSGGTGRSKKEANGSTRTNEICVADKRTSQPPIANPATTSSTEADPNTAAQKTTLELSKQDGQNDDNQIRTFNDQSEDRKGKGSTSDSGSGVLTDVVSARPGFLTSAQATNGTSSKQKKLSWIKRLSLTISNESYLSGDETSNGGTISSNNSQKVATSLSTDPCGTSSPTNQATTTTNSNGAITNSSDQPKLEEQQQPKKDKPKRKSLFSGGLTLGRSSNKQNRASSKTATLATATTSK